MGPMTHCDVGMQLLKGAGHWPEDSTNHHLLAHDVSRDLGGPP
jgi:hypothetical protein